MIMKMKVSMVISHDNKKLLIHHCLWIILSEKVLGLFMGGKILNIEVKKVLAFISSRKIRIFNFIKLIQKLSNRFRNNLSMIYQAIIKSKAFGERSLWCDEDKFGLVCSHEKNEKW